MQRRPHHQLSAFAANAILILFGIVTLSLICNVSVLNSKTHNDNNFLDSNEVLLLQDQRQKDHDPIQTYIQEMDLSKVPPQGSPPNLPSVRVTDAEAKENVDDKRKIYGGRGDKAHLGGFTTIDSFGLSPRVWRDMMEYFGVKTLLDVGCGKGISTSWFYLQGVEVQCKFFGILPFFLLQ